MSTFQTTFDALYSAPVAVANISSHAITSVASSKTFIGILLAAALIAFIFYQIGKQNAEYEKNNNIKLPK